MFTYVQTSVVRPIAREMDGSGSYHKLTGEAAEPPAEVPSAVVGAATQDRSLEDAGRRDCQTHMEEEEEESASSSDSSEDVDEHRLLRESSDDKKQTRREKQGSSTPAVTSTNLASSPTGDEASTNPSDLINEEDIDPFSFYPPLTKWDYLKVSAVGVKFCSHNFFSIKFS